VCPGHETSTQYFSCTGGPGAVSTKNIIGSVGHIVHPCAYGRKMSMHYFSCSCGTGTISIKSAPRHITPNLCFCIRCDLRVMYYILELSGHKMSIHYFSYSGGPGVVSIKSAPGHVTPNLCFCIRSDLQLT
jgi:hypothetical protein